MELGRDSDNDNDNADNDNAESDNDNAESDNAESETGTNFEGVNSRTGGGLANLLQERAQLATVFNNLDVTNAGEVPIEDFQRAIIKQGIMMDDPRIMDSVAYMEKLQEQGSNITLTDALWMSLQNSLIGNALSHELVIDDFEKLCRDFDECFEEAKSMRSKLADESTGGWGKNASYIPQLATVNPNQWAAAVTSVDGQRWNKGDTNVRFSVQSSSKPITYCMALQEHGEEFVHRHVGREPSGRRFNNLSLDEHGLPHNPCINAGAICCTALVQPDSSPADRFESIMQTWEDLCGGVRPGFAASMMLSEQETADRNFCLAYMMRESKALPSSADIKDTLDLYFMTCSIEVTCDMMSVVAATLANGGQCPTTAQRVFSPRTVRNCLSIMSSCGMYDFSGRFAFQIGLPAKSGVSGIIMLVIPNYMGVACYCPRLDKLGNSVFGINFCFALTSRFYFRYNHSAHELRTDIDGEPNEGEQDKNEGEGEEDEAVEDKDEEKAGTTATQRLKRKTPHKKKTKSLRKSFSFYCADDVDATDTQRKDPRKLLSPNDRVSGELDSDHISMLWAAAEENVIQLRRMVARGVSVDSADYDFRTPMHVAASAGKLDAVKYLFGLGASVSLQDRYGGMPLDDAIREGHDDVAQFLRNVMASPEASQLKLFPSSSSSSSSETPPYGASTPSMTPMYLNAAATVHAWNEAHDSGDEASEGSSDSEENDNELGYASDDEDLATENKEAVVADTDTEDAFDLPTGPLKRVTSEPSHENGEKKSTTQGRALRRGGKSQMTTTSPPFSGFPNTLMEAAQQRQASFNKRIRFAKGTHSNNTGDGTDEHVTNDAIENEEGEKSEDVAANDDTDNAANDANGYGPEDDSDDGGDENEGDKKNGNEDRRTRSKNAGKVKKKKKEKHPNSKRNGTTISLNGCTTPNGASGKQEAKLRDDTSKETSLFLSDYETKTSGLQQSSNNVQSLLFRIGPNNNNSNISSNSAGEASSSKSQSNRYTKSEGHDANPPPQNDSIIREKAEKNEVDASALSLSSSPSQLLSEEGNMRQSCVGQDGFSKLERYRRSMFVLENDKGTTKDFGKSNSSRFKRSVATKQHSNSGSSSASAGNTQNTENAQTAQIPAQLEGLKPVREARDVSELKNMLFSCLRWNGIRVDSDPRIAPLKAPLENPGDFLEKALEIPLVRKTVEGRAVIADWSDFRKDFENIFHEVAALPPKGQVANYSKQLRDADAESLSFSMCSVDGQRASYGDAAKQQFPLQALGRIASYACALEQHGIECVHKHVGYEPSGSKFNALILDEDKLPHNPFLNAGGFVTCSMIDSDKSKAHRFETLSSLWEGLSGGHRPGFDTGTFLAERETSDRNYCLAYMVKEAGAFAQGTVQSQKELTSTMELYFQTCAMMMDCDALAVAAATLANNGICPITGTRILSKETVQCVTSIMMSSGLYDFSGEFQFSVGVPAKSSVSGGLMIVVPGVLGVCIRSARLDRYGNSTKGVELCRRMSQRYMFHSYDHLRGHSESKAYACGSQKDVPSSGFSNPLLHKGNNYEAFSSSLMFASARGDLSEIFILHGRGVDLNVSDYDSRTALHLAASEGRYLIVKFLLSNGADPTAKDRWGGTPLSNAVWYGHMRTARLLEKFTSKFARIDEREGERAEDQQKC